MSDNCFVCRGQKGGVRGNENVVRGILMCDYCTIDWMDAMRGKPVPPLEGRFSHFKAEGRPVMPEDSVRDVPIVSSRQIMQGGSLYAGE